MGEVIEFPDERVAPRRLLRDALEAQLHVELERSIADAETIRGHVGGLSDDWVIIARLSDRLLPDGWTFVPAADVRSVVVDPDPECFPNRALRARGLWPPPTAPESMRPFSVLDAIRTASRITPLVSLFLERDDPEICVIGTVAHLDQDVVELRLITPAARWEEDTTSYDLDDVTRVECGGGYEDALFLAVGLLPSPPR